MNLSINNQKKQIRNFIKNQKALFHHSELKEKSDHIIKQLLNLSAIKNSEIILSYWSLENEVHTHDLNNIMTNLGKTILLPSVDNNNLIIRYFNGEENMIEVPPFGIKESTGAIFDSLHLIQEIIVPGIAFDYEFNRLGRGKGFYDRFLKNITCTKIGICFDFQLLDSIPHDENDVKMNIIVSENKILSRN